MARRLVLYIAVSLDGYIARRNGSIDWLLGYEGPQITASYEALLSGVDTLVMGRVTYDQLVGELLGDRWPYAGKTCYVATSRPIPPNERVTFVSSDIVRLVREQKAAQGGDIWLVGGATLIRPFVREGLIDRYVISIIPTLLGDGIPLFYPGFAQSDLRLIEAKNHDGIAELTLEPKK